MRGATALLEQVVVAAELSKVRGEHFERGSGVFEKPFEGLRGFETILSGPAVVGQVDRDQVGGEDAVRGSLAGQEDCDA